MRGCRRWRTAQPSSVIIPSTDHLDLLSHDREGTLMR